MLQHDGLFFTWCSFIADQYCLLLQLVLFQWQQPNGQHGCVRRLQLVAFSLRLRRHEHTTPARSQRVPLVDKPEFGVRRRAAAEPDARRQTICGHGQAADERVERVHYVIRRLPCIAWHTEQGWCVAHNNAAERQGYWGRRRCHDGTVYRKEQHKGEHSYNSMETKLKLSMQTEKYIIRYYLKFFESIIRSYYK